MRIMLPTRATFDLYVTLCFYSEHIRNRMQTRLEGALLLPGKWVMFTLIVFCKNCGLCRRFILGHRTLIHYLPCTVPSWHEVSIYFMDGRGQSIRLDEGKLAQNRFFLNVPYLIETMYFQPSGASNTRTIQHHVTSAMEQWWKGNFGREALLK